MREKSKAPVNARHHARIRLSFSPYFCIIIPEGIDIRAYAIKKEKGSNPVMVPVNEKLSLTFGFIEPRILVRNEIAKNTRKIRLDRK
jgi:hypothetical protein